VVGLEGRAAPVMANIFSALDGKSSATPSVGTTIAAVSSVWRGREKGAPSPDTSTSSV
jgi:hypothetical protein